MLSLAMQGPKSYIKQFEKYKPLLNKDAEMELEKFLQEEHTFSDYEKQVLRYKETLAEVQYEVEKVNCESYDNEICQLFVTN